MLSIAGAETSTVRRVIFAARPAIDWHELFGNTNAVEIEIGCGKGAFLLAFAAAHPDVNVLGIERQPRWVRIVADRMGRRGLANARVVAADAAVVVGRFVPDASVAAYHVYFPDPWWKKRHQKRRLVVPEFAAALHRTLAPGGTIHLATDVADRFEAMLAAFEGLPFEVNTDAPRDAMPITNFERKYSAEGRPIYRVRFVKRC